MSSVRLRRGEVVAFDDERGLGTVIDADTGNTYPFHCIEIADGSRSIDTGAPVAFEVVHKLGRPEARRLVAG
jgi:cold shock CspA family protein